MSMSLHIAFAGFRHGHIFDLLQRCQSGEGIEVVALGEENFDASLMGSKGLKATHADIGAMIKESGCNAVAIAPRLKAGKIGRAHV